MALMASKVVNQCSLMTSIMMHHFGKFSLSASLHCVLVPMITFVTSNGLQSESLLGKVALIASEVTFLHFYSQ